MINFLVSAAGSASVVLLLYAIYLLSARALARRIQGYGCWWLPAWNCWRLVVRNIGGKMPLCAIKFRVWLRTVVPAMDGASVKSFRDQELAQGERVVLPVGQDQPMLCFRLEATGRSDLFMIITDKFGTEIQRIDLASVEIIRFEFTFRVRQWGVFKHEVFRSVFWTRSRSTFPGRDLFRDYLLDRQSGPESKMAGFVKSVDETLVSV